MSYYIGITGNVVDGLNFVGPFDTPDYGAMEYCNDEWVASLLVPAAPNGGLWENPLLQFARLIAEIEAAGGFTEALYQDLQTSMDLPADRIDELIDRAQEIFEENKPSPTDFHKPR